MSAPPGKRRRVEGGESPGGGAEGAAAASHISLSAALRASLAEASAAAALAASARTEATKVAARSMAEASAAAMRCMEEAIAAVARCMAEANAAAARSTAACQAAESAAALAVASASAFARELGIEADDSGLVAAGGVERSGTASATKGALGDGEGNGGVAVIITEAASASKVGRGDGGGNGGVSIFHLPDAILEMIFDLLGEVPVDGPKRYFPCKPALSSFALSCRRFAKLFREAYVTHDGFDAVFRFAKDRRDYQEVVSGALLRFTNVDTVSAINFDCCPEPGNGDSDAVVWDEDEDVYVLNDSRELNFRVAVADRGSLPEAVAGRIGHLSGGSKVKILRFDQYDCIPEARVASGVVGWKFEHAGWLEYFPNVTAVVFDDSLAFRSSSRSCGAGRASLKSLDINLDNFFLSRHDMRWDEYLLVFLHFRNIEVLVLFCPDALLLPEDLELLMLPKVLELLPQLDDFGIQLPTGHPMPDGIPLDGADQPADPLLRFLFRNPSLPVEGRCKLRVHVRIYYAGELEEEESTLKTLRTRVAGDFLPYWEVTKAPQSSVLLRSLTKNIGDHRYLDLLATFRPEPFPSSQET